MERIAIVEKNKIVNVVNAPADWLDPEGRELVFAARGAGVEIDALRQSDGTWKIPELSVEKQARSARKKRNLLLDNSDWTQVPDAPVDQAAWAEYRQALRDLPEQAGFPTEITWPQKP